MQGKKELVYQALKSKLDPTLAEVQTHNYKVLRYVKNCYIGGGAF